MNTDTRNGLGLFDAPARFSEKERVAFTQEDMERQLDAGAFVMDRQEAIAAGFLSPHDDSDTVIVDALREDV